MKKRSLILIPLFILTSCSSLKFDEDAKECLVHKSNLVLGETVVSVNNNQFIKKINCTFGQFNCTDVEIKLDQQKKVKILVTKNNLTIYEKEKEWNSLINDSGLVIDREKKAITHKYRGNVSFHFSNGCSDENAIIGAMGIGLVEGQDQVAD